MRNKNIDGYKNYIVNENGEVTNTNTGRLLKHSKNQKGYCFLILSKKGFSETVSIHRLVYRTFKGELNKGFEINHIDGDKSNNNILNLEQVSKTENMRKAVETGLIKSGLDCPLSVPVIKLDPMTKKIIERYGSISIASKDTGVASSAISLVINGKRKTAGKFIWAKIYNHG